MVEYGKKPEPKAKPEGPKPSEIIRRKADQMWSNLDRTVDQRSHLRLSTTAVFGWITGGLIFFNGITTLGSMESAIHQIYQVLCFGQGGLLIAAGSIAQHTKNSKDN